MCVYLCLGCWVDLYVFPWVKTLVLNQEFRTRVVYPCDDFSRCASYSFLVAIHVETTTVYMLGIWRIITLFTTVKPAHSWMILVVSIARRGWGKF